MKFVSSVQSSVVIQTSLLDSIIDLLPISPIFY